MAARIIVGNCLDELRKLPSDSVHCAVTSPPYWGLRDYGIDPQVWGGDPECEHEFVDEQVERSVRKGMGLEELGNRYRGGGKKHGTIATFTIHRGSCAKCGAWRGSLGLEPTPELFVENMVSVFDEVWRVLRPDGTCWVNIGDCYASGGGASEQGRSGDRFERAHTQKYLNVNKGGRSNLENTGKHRRKNGPSASSTLRGNGHSGGGQKLHAAIWPVEAPNRMPQTGLKPKDLVGVPWMLAFALRSAGWYLRQEIIWQKPNPMPESIEDRCTKAHEQIFLLAKSETYFYDAEAIKESASENTNPRGIKLVTPKSAPEHSNIKAKVSFHAGTGLLTSNRNKRSVWTVSTKPFAEAHFATFPPDLIEPCVLAGTSERGCCERCGSGWARVVAKSVTFESGSGRSGNDIEGKGHPSSQIRDGHDIRMGPTISSETVGWWPTCDCAGLGDLPKLPRVEKPIDDAARSRWRAACAKVYAEWRERCARPEVTEAARTLVPAVVLDPFGDAGTTGLVADRLRRDAILLELNPKYAEMARQRLAADGGLFSNVAAE